MQKQLEVGSRAPNFHVKDVFGNQVSLGSFGDKKFLLVFLRYSGCPWCNLAIHRLAVEYPLLKKQGCEVIAFIQSSEAAIKKNIYGRHAKKPAFPIIADPARKVYKKYDIVDSKVAFVKSITNIPTWVHAVRSHGFRQQKLDGSLFLVPASFLIDGSTGEILIAKYASSFYEHETFTSIYEALTFQS